jgi:hypothetical protein
MFMEQLIDMFLQMSNRDLYLAFTAIAIPFAVAAINNAVWAPMIKWLCYAVLCVASSAGFVWAYDSFDTDDLPRLFLLIGLVAIATYHFFKKPLAHFEVLTDRLVKREPAATLSPPAVEIQPGPVVEVAKQ